MQTEAYEVVRFNALKHGILSRYTALSHESHTNYESLVNSLMDERLPACATEQHLIEELDSVIWRKGGDHAYDKALRALLSDSREWWESYEEEDEYAADAEGLAAFVN
jgi:hypothetical protein